MLEKFRSVAEKVLMPLPPLSGSAISLCVHANDWREAVNHAGAALVASGATTTGYAHRMIEVIEEFGPYAVIAPGLALVHARPGLDVLEEGLAVIILSEPVPFGHPYNDPVHVVIGVSSVTNDEHVTSVAELANVFNDQSAVPRLVRAVSVDEVRSVFAAASNGRISE